MDIADKSETDLTMEVLRRESDKENQPPQHDSNIKTVDTPSVKEVVSFTETSKKTSEEKEGLRIKSVTVVPDSKPFETFSSSKLEEPLKEKASDQSVEPFPSFKDIQSSTPADTCSSSKQEYVSGDDKNFTKTTVETKHEVKDGTEMSFVKKEQESISKSTNDSQAMPDITLDTIDLNNLISETQKRLDSFKNNFKSDGLFDTPLLSEIKKTEIISSSKISETKSSEAKSFETSNLLNGDITVQKESKNLEKNIETEVSKPDPVFSLPDIGFTSQSSETSDVTMDIPFGTSTTTITKKSPEPSDESAPGTPEIQGAEPPTPDPSQVPFRPSKGPTKLKLVLDPRQILNIDALRSSGYVISEHNVISPEVCHGLVKDLQSPVGKGAALFAKRKKKSEEWVVDEEKVKALLREQEQRKFAAPPTSSPYPTIGRQEIKLVRSPWEAAMQNPYGFCDSAFARVNPDQLADTVIKRADYKRSESLSRESSRMEGCISPPAVPPLTPAGAMYDIYHAKAPKGWLGGSGTTNYSSPVPPNPPPPVSSIPIQQTSNFQNGYQPKKMVFQNFNTVPRCWKGTSVH